MFRRGGKLWAWKKENGKLVRRSTGCTDRKAAEAVVREWERQASDPTYRGAIASTLADGINWLLADRKRRGRADATLEMYDQKTAHLGRVFGDCPLADLTAERIDNYIEQREQEGAAPGTVHKELVAIRGILKLARRRGAFHLEPSAVMPIGYSPKYVPRTRYLPYDRWEDLLQKLPAKRAAQVAWMLSTGANLSEAEHAKREHASDADIFIDGRKTKFRNRTIPILEPMKKFIDFSLLHAPGVDPLFEPWANIWRDLHIACEEIDHEKLSSNDLRRSFCSLLVQAGVPFDLAAKLMGHGSTTMVTRVYGQLSSHHITSLVHQYFPTPSTGLLRRLMRAKKRNRARYRARVA